MFKRILTPLDGSNAAEQALAYAALLAAKMKAHLDLIRVIDPVPSATTSDPAHAEYQERLAARLTREAQDYLSGVAGRLERQGISEAIRVVQGDPAAEILAAADAPDTLIAMSTHGWSGMGHWELGSVTNKVLHATQNPLLMVRCHQGDAAARDLKLDTVVVPLDGSVLAQGVLTSVTALAKVMGLKADLVTVIPSVGGAPASFEIVPATGDVPGQEVAEQAGSYLRRTSQELRRQGVAGVEEHVLQGHPAVAIIDYARSVPNSILIMASHGRSGIGRWRLGSITDLVARNCEGPVLVIHTVQPESSEPQSNTNSAS
jgi:nucleotide-binding universal stress UspA family protein